MNTKIGLRGGFMLLLLSGLLFSPHLQTLQAQGDIQPAAAFGSCGDAATGIYSVQGTGATSPMVGMTDVVIEGVVVGDFQDTANELGGFFLQEEDGDADASLDTSDGIFVFDNGFGVGVSHGHLVRVRGDVAEVANETRLINVDNVVVCSGSPVASVASLTLPAPNTTYLEQFEGMQVQFLQTLYVTDVTTLGSQGEVGLSGSAPLTYPTNLFRPGTGNANTLASINARNFIYLDDASNALYKTPILHLQPDDSLRIGSSYPGVSGALGFSNGQYRIQRNSGITFSQPSRESAPPVLNSDLEIALIDANEFTNVLTSTGPNNTTEFDRLRDKLVQTIITSDASVIALTRIRNNGDGGTSTIFSLVNGPGGLNAVAGAGTYAYVGNPPTGLGADTNRVGLIYRTADISTVGSPVSSTDVAFGGRRPLAQTFEAIGGGEVFTVVVAWFAERTCVGGETGGNADAGDSQDCYNADRTAAATALVNWVGTDPTSSSDDDFLIMGNLNAYGQEDPVYTLTNSGGYIDLMTRLLDAQRYTYNAGADGLGYMNHALASPTMNVLSTSFGVWNINADEPLDLLDYNTENKPASLQALGAGNVYASSPFNPVLVGIDITPNNAPVLAGNATMTTIPEDTTAGSSAGERVFDLTNGIIGDIDSADPRGIAIIDQNAANGTWQYTVNSTTWVDVPNTVSSSNALLLLGDGDTRLRYIPDPNAYGVVNPGLTIHAWDQSNDLQEGVFGDIAATGTGDPTPYSSASRNINIEVTAVADTPNVTNATTFENTQTTDGLVITRNLQDGAEVTHYQITNISDGFLFKNDGTSVISNGAFITIAEGAAGLKFTPAANSVVNGSFQVRASIGSTGAGLGGNAAGATITVIAVANTPSITSTSTLEDTQSTSGLVITRNAQDGPEVAFFKVTNISGGTLYQNDGTTQINNNQFISYAQGNAGLRFTPITNSTVDGTFRIQAATTSTDIGLGGDVVTALITVTPVNDAPSFTKGATVRVPQSSGLQTFSGWATNISMGPSDESGQTPSFNLTVLSATGNLSFSAPPAISPDGTLTFTPTPNTIGSALVSVVLQDNGGIANGGVNSSEAQNFGLVVFAPNIAMSIDAPASGAFVSTAYSVSGWALDRAPGAGNGPGVNLVRVYDGTSCSGTVLGETALSISRPDVRDALSLDASYTDSGWQIDVTGQTGGPKTISVCLRLTANGDFVFSQTRSFNIPAPVTGTDTLALFNNSTGAASFINTLQDQPPGAAYANFTPGAPVAGVWTVGDWNGNGQETPGVFSGGAFHFTNDFGPSANWSALWLGPPVGTPVAGRFNPNVNHACVGLIEQASSTIDNVTFDVFVLWYTCDFSTNAPTVTWHWVSAPLQTFDGFSGEFQFAVGDWDGDGLDTVAVRRNEFVAYSNVPIVNPSAVAPQTPANTYAEFAFAQYFGVAPSMNTEGDFVTGDWNNNGSDTFGVLYDNNSFFYRNDLEWNSGVFILQGITDAVGGPRTVTTWASSSVPMDTFLAAAAGSATSSAALPLQDLAPETGAGGNLQPLPELQPLGPSTAPQTAPQEEAPLTPLP